MKRIVAFDFDGTITRKDTLLEFIRFAKGNTAFVGGFLIYSPLLIAFKLKLYPNWKAKQKIFSHFFKRMPIEHFNALCESFFKQKSSSLLYPSAIRTIQKYLSEHNEVLIISASVENWIQPFAQNFGVHKVLGTRIEIDKEGYLTGRFLTANCYGKEKVNRLLEIYPHRREYYLIAYGDSKGDKELLAFADESYYKAFHN